MASSGSGGFPPVPDTSLAPIMLGIVWAMNALATIIVALRIFTSATVARWVSVSDFLIVASLLTGMTSDAFFTLSAKYGLGRHISYLTLPQLENTLKYEVMAEPIGMLAPLLARVSFAIFLLQLVGPFRPNRHTLHFCIVSSILVNGAAIIFFLGQCGDHIDGLWNVTSTAAGHCLKHSETAPYSFFQGGFNTVIDFILTVIPAWIVFNVKMPTKIKVGLMGILGLSLIASGASVVRTIKLSNLFHTQDFTRELAPFVIWAKIEHFTVIAAASVPTIRPLFTHRRKQRATRYGETSNLASSSVASSQAPMVTDSKFPKLTMEPRPAAVRPSVTRQTSDELKEIDNM